MVDSHNSAPGDLCGPRVERLHITTMESLRELLYDAYDSREVLKAETFVTMDVLRYICPMPVDQTGGDEALQSLQMSVTKSLIDAAGGGHLPAAWLLTSSLFWEVENRISQRRGLRGLLKRRYSVELAGEGREIEYRRDPKYVLRAGMFSVAEEAAFVDALAAIRRLRSFLLLSFRHENKLLEAAELFCDTAFRVGVRTSIAKIDWYRILALCLANDMCLLRWSGAFDDPWYSIDVFGSAFEIDRLAPSA